MFELIVKLPYGIKNLIFSLYGLNISFRRNRGQHEYFAEFKSFDLLTEEAKTTWINNRLKYILNYSRNNVKHYRDFWDNHPDIDHLRLANWPILNKDDIRGNERDFISDQHHKSSLIKVNTSGTSGTPMVFYFDHRSYARWFSIYYYNLLIKNGINLKQDRWVNIGGRIICDPDQEKPPFWIHNFAMNQIYMSSYHLSEENIKYYIKKMVEGRITYILGYPSSINGLATWILRNEQKFQINLKAIFTNAEPLTDLQRENISAAFNCKVIQTYGSSEFALAASESDGGQMEIWPQTGILEILNPNEEGLGEFLITGLVNEAMPLIRYRLGDSGIVSPEEVLPSKINKIEGRTDDLIQIPDGRVIGRLDPIFKKEFKICEAQVVQVEIDRLIFRIVRDAGYTMNDEMQITIEARKRLGKEVKIDFEYVSYIERSKNGKFKTVVSLIN